MVDGLPPTRTISVANRGVDDCSAMQVGQSRRRAPWLEFTAVRRRDSPTDGRRAPENSIGYFDLSWPEWFQMMDAGIEYVIGRAERNHVDGRARRPCPDDRDGIAEAEPLLIESSRTHVDGFTRCAFCQCIPGRSARGCGGGTGSRRRATGGDIEDGRRRPCRARDERERADKHGRDGNSTREKCRRKMSADTEGSRARTQMLAIGTRTCESTSSIFALRRRDEVDSHVAPSRARSRAITRHLGVHPIGDLTRTSPHSRGDGTHPRPEITSRGL